MKDLKVVFGPDEVGAFAPLQWALEEGPLTPDRLGKWAFFHSLRHEARPEVWASFDDQALALAEAWDDPEEFDVLRHRLPQSMWRWVDEAIDNAWITARQLERIHPDLIIAMHGTCAHGLWFLGTELGLTDISLVLEEAYQRGYRRVWVIACNPDGVAPEPPEGMEVWWRKGISNPLYGGQCLWQVEG